MHKNPTKERFIAASKVCMTKKLSKVLAQCFKKIQSTLKWKDKAFFRKNKIKRFWIVENSIEIVNLVERTNAGTGIGRKVTNLGSFDFSNLYTTIDHESLKEELGEVIDEAFKHNKKNYLWATEKSASFQDKICDKEGTHNVSPEKLKLMLKVLLDNIYVMYGNVVYKQEIGVPMGTDCAPFLANLYLYARESKWIDSLIEGKKLEMAKKVSLNSRYIDDLLAINCSNELWQH